MSGGTNSATLCPLCARPMPPSGAHDCPYMPPALPDHLVCVLKSNASANTDDRPTAPCPKCGGTARARYCSGKGPKVGCNDDHLYGRLSGEHLRFTCPCGYGWNAPCKDAES